VERVQIDCSALHGPLATEGPSLCLLLTSQMELRVKVMVEREEVLVHVVQTAASESGVSSLMPSGASAGGAGLMTPAMQVWQRNAAAGHRAHVEFSAHRTTDQRDILEGVWSSSEEDSDQNEEEDDEGDSATAAASALAAAATATMELEVVLNAILTEALGHSNTQQSRYHSSLDAEAASRALARFLRTPGFPPERPPQPPRVDMSGHPCPACQARTTGPLVTLGSDVAVKAFVAAAAQMMPKLVKSSEDRDVRTEEPGLEDLPNSANISPRRGGREGSHGGGEEDPLEVVLKNQVCVLCLGSFCEPTTLVCGHSFCKGCIHAALSHQAACPVCRKASRHVSRLRPVNRALSELLKAAALPRDTPEARCAREKAILQAAECPMCKSALQDPVTNPCGHSVCRKCNEGAQRAFQESAESLPDEEEDVDDLDSHLHSPPLSPASSVALRDSLAAAEARVRNAQRAGAVALAMARSSEGRFEASEGRYQLQMLEMQDEGITVVELSEESPRQGQAADGPLPPLRPSTGGWVDNDSATDVEATEQTASTCRCIVS